MTYVVPLYQRAAHGCVLRRLPILFDAMPREGPETSIGAVTVTGGERGGGGVLENLPYPVADEH